MNGCILKSFPLICFLLCHTFASSLDFKALLNILGLDSRGCIGVDPQENFSLDRLQGIWFASYQINKLLSSDPPCQTLDFKKTGPESLTIDLNSRLMKGVVMRASAKGRVVNTTTPALMSFEWDFVPDVPETTVIAETDYDNYAVLITCDYFGKVTTGFLLSRQEKIRDSSFEQGKAVLDQHFDETGYFMQTKECNLNPINPNEKIIGMGSTDMDELFKALLSK